MSTSARAIVFFLLAGTGRLAGDELPAKPYSSRDGLVDNRVRRIVEDSRGFLWFATGGGLARYDGLIFASFGGEQGDPTTSTNDLLEDRSGNYWVATNGAGLIRFRAEAPVSQKLGGAGERFQVYSVSGQAAANRVNKLYADRRGYLWLGTDGGLFRLEERRSQASIVRMPARIPGVADEALPVWDLVEDPEGSVWAGTSYGLIRNLPDGRTIHYPLRSGAGSDRVSSLRCDSRGRLWIGHQTGLFVFKPEPLDRIAAVNDVFLRRVGPGPLPALPGEVRFYGGPDRSHPTITALNILRSGEVWIGTPYRGVFRLDSEQFRPIARAGIAEVSSILEDRDSNVWVGSQRFGAVKMLRHGFASYGGADGVVALPRTVLMNRAGGIDLAMAGWRMAHWKEGRFLSSLLSPGESAGETWRSAEGVLQDHLGAWWIATRAGLYRYAKAERLDLLGTRRPSKIYTRSDGLESDDVYRLFEDSRGDIWISTFAPGRHAITRWDRATETFHHYGEREGLPAFNAPSAIVEDQDCNVWVGFREGGLARYRHGSFHLFGAAEGAGSGIVRACYLDHANRLWCAFAQSGLFRFDSLNGDRLEPVVYDRRRGLSMNTVVALGEDQQGRIYAGTLSGVDQIDPTVNRIEHFTESDGLAGGAVQKIVCDRSNALWIVTLEGVSRFVPETNRPTYRPQALISGLRIAGLEYPLSPVGHTRLSLPDLPASRSSLQFEYLVVGAGTGAAVLVNYKLDGSDPEWAAPTTARSVNYANLPPGSYSFKARVSGQDDSTAAIVSFRILPPFWRTWWFLGAALGLVASTLITFERYRVGHMRRLAAALAVSEENERRFRTLAETASDAILTLGEDGVIRFANPAVESTFGYPASELIGREVTLLMPQAFRESQPAGMEHDSRPSKRLISGKGVSLTGLHRDGRELPLEVSFGEFTHEGERYITGVVRDVTERKQVEERLARAREERLAELERVRKRIASDLHDEIGSSLTQISILSEVVLRSVDKPAVTLPLSNIAATSRELIDAMSDIVWAINPAKDHLSDLTSRMRRVTADTFATWPCTVRLELPSDDGIKLGANTRRELFLIFKEGINNIAKHAMCTEVSIRLAAHEGVLTLELRDNGRGFDPSLMYEGHGLASLRSRATSLGGAIEIESAPAQGTAVRLRVPIPSESRLDKRDYKSL